MSEGPILVSEAPSIPRTVRFKGNFERRPAKNGTASTNGSRQSSADTPEQASGANIGASKLSGNLFLDRCMRIS